jgi:hypothetical protein
MSRIGFTTRCKGTHRTGVPFEQRPGTDATVISDTRLGGLHHRYARRQAASVEKRLSTLARKQSQPL